MGLEADDPVNLLIDRHLLNAARVLEGYTANDCIQDQSAVLFPQ